MAGEEQEVTGFRLGKGRRERRGQRGESQDPTDDR